MTKFNIKNTNEYRNLLENRTVAGIIKSRVSSTGTRQIIDDYFNWLKEKYPTVTSSLDNLLKQKEQDLNEAINSQQESKIRVLIFDILEASAKEIREQSRQQLNKLFTQPMSLDFQKVDKKPVEDLKINSRVFYDTNDVAFLVNSLIEEVFFNLIPRELEKELNQEPKVELSELPAEWNTKRNELLLSICTKSIRKVRHLSDLEPVEEAINEKCQELIDVIQKLRSNKNNLQHQALLKKVQELTTQLQNTKELKEKIHNVAVQVNRRWVRAQIIDRQEADAVLGKDWELDLSELNTLEEVNKRQTKLIEAIDQREKIEKQKQVEHEKEIQTEINKAQSFINNLNLTAEDSNSLLEKLRNFRNEWGASSNPAKWHAFLNKNKEDAINKIIRDLQDKIRGEKAVHLITQSLNQEPQLQAYDLGEKYANFVSTLRGMNDQEKMNEYENEALIVSAPAHLQPIRPIRARLNKLINSANEILDSNNNSLQAQQNRAKALNILIELEEFRNSSKQTNESVWLVYTWRRTEINRLVNPISGTLYQEVRKRALDRLTKKKELLKRQGIVVDENEFNNYQRQISRANSQELQDQKYENEFLTKVLQQTQQPQIVQPPIIK